MKRLIIIKNINKKSHFLKFKVFEIGETDLLSISGFIVFAKLFIKTVFPDSYNLFIFKIGSKMLPVIFKVSSPSESG